MPFYEYECKSCGHELEAMQKVTEPPLKKCPECGKSSLQRLMSAPVFRLKGGGWYETDFKSDQDGKRNLADRPEPDAPKEEKSKDDKSKDDKKDSTDKKADAVKDAKPAEKSGDAAGPKAAAKKPLSRSGKASAAKARPKKPARGTTARAKRRR